MIEKAIFEIEFIRLCEEDEYIKAGLLTTNWNVLADDEMERTFLILMNFIHNVIMADVRMTKIFMEAGGMILKGKGIEGIDLENIIKRNEKNRDN